MDREMGASQAVAALYERHTLGADPARVPHARRQADGRGRGSGGILRPVGILTGDKFRPLPHVALAPLLFAINSGGFQNSGGYVGFAW